MFMTRMSCSCGATCLSAPSSLPPGEFADFDRPRTCVHDVRENEVIEILERGHTGPRDAIAGTIARVKGRGPFKRFAVSGARIGQLKFQPPRHDRQCSL